MPSDNIRSYPHKNKKIEILILIKVKLPEISNEKKEEEEDKTAHILRNATWQSSMTLVI